MKKFVNHGILSLALLTGMGWLGSVAQAVTLQVVPPHQQVGTQFPELEEITVAEINALASRYCHGLNSATDQIQCVQRLNQCVLGAGNRFGCEPEDPNGEVYQCESSQGIHFTMETMVQLCHENPNPTLTIDNSRVISGRRTPVIQTLPQGGNRVGVVDPDLIRDATRRLHPGPLQVVDDGVNRNEPDPIGEREDVVAAAPAAEEIIDADSGADGEITGSGFGCSLGAGASSNAEAYWIIGLLAAAPLAWPRRRKKSKSPTQGQ